MNLQLPSQVKQLSPAGTFRFACHPGVSCFTDCCRELELALTPYDVLRLKNRLRLPAAEFLDRYVLIERDENRTFPSLYLGMVDDGRASCPFVSEQGCTVYPDRPGACRTYPLGRAVSRTTCGGLREFHVLLTEEHCRGFTEDADEFTAAGWMADQGLAEYNRFNDEMFTLLQYEKRGSGRRLSDSEVDLFILALYTVDDFRQLILKEGDPGPPLNAPERDLLARDDSALLRYGIRWLAARLFRISDP